MEDKVIGVAVLFEEDGIEFLMIRCQCGDGRILPTDIPVYPAGGTPIRNPSWEYTIRGDELDVRPSVNWVGVFHNSGAWSVKFVRHDTSQYKYAGDQFREVNGTQVKI